MLEVEKCDNLRAHWNVFSVGPKKLASIYKNRGEPPQSHWISPSKASQVISGGSKSLLLRLMARQVELLHVWHPAADCAKAIYLFCLAGCQSIISTTRCANIISITRLVLFIFICDPDITRLEQLPPSRHRGRKNINPRAPLTATAF